LHGNSWSKIATLLPGRTQLQIRDRWRHLLGVRRKRSRDTVQQNVTNPLAALTSLKAQGLVQGIPASAPGWSLKGQGSFDFTNQAQIQAQMQAQIQIQIQAQIQAQLHVPQDVANFNRNSFAKMPLHALAGLTRGLTSGAPSSISYPLMAQQTASSLLGMSVSIPGRSGGGGHVGGGSLPPKKRKMASGNGTGVAVGSTQQVVQHPALPSFGAFAASAKSSQSESGARNVDPRLSALDSLTQLHQLATKQNVNVAPSAALQTSVAQDRTAQLRSALAAATNVNTLLAASKNIVSPVRQQANSTKNEQAHTTLAAPSNRSASLVNGLHPPPHPSTLSNKPGELLNTMKLIGRCQELTASLASKYPIEQAAKKDSEIDSKKDSETDSKKGSKTDSKKDSEADSTKPQKPQTEPKTEPKLSEQELSLNRATNKDSRSVSEQPTTQRSPETQSW
jgi:hypothetical protein